MTRSRLVHNYCEAVERDPRAHPVQPARDLLPPGIFASAADLYDYTVCPFGRDGRALPPDAPISELHAIIFDNVYARTGRHVHPANADWAAARSESFVPTGGVRDQAFADALWARTVQRWGEPETMAADPDDNAAVAVRPPAVLDGLRAPAALVPEGGKSMVKILSGRDEWGEDLYLVFEVDLVAGTMARVTTYETAAEAVAFKDGYNWRIHRGAMFAMRRDVAAGTHAEFTGAGPDEGFAFDFDDLLRTEDRG
ncbi:MAG: hypothetical protein HY875_14370 [Chloroflexi bacterium]|nr:hypothetical protein [Chloroflexota bacterium]